ncbi:MAG: putative capsular polysaccharide synthesis family protein [Butyrivibrio sp.]|nr:putative capsular polysaccharide synthesis family protein [Butyrivibrio sp.]
MRFSFIDKDFHILKTSKIIIYDAGNDGVFYYKKLKRLGAKVSFFCDANKDYQRMTVDGIHVISLEKLYDIYDDSMIICIFCRNWYGIAKILETKGIYRYISLDEFCKRTYDYSRYISLTDKSLHDEYLLCAEGYNERGISVIRYDYDVWKYLITNQIKDNHDNLIVCSPQKTGDFTINYTLDRYGKKYINFWHCCKYFSEGMGELFRKYDTKIIIGIREPVGQNISAFFESSRHFWDVEEFWEDGGDVQYLFDSWISCQMNNDMQWSRKENISRKKLVFPYADYFRDNCHIDYIIQNFFDNQIMKNIGINVYEYAADKENGYSIIRMDNLSIFIYQVEKLDLNKKVLGEFLGIDDIELVRGNEASYKWYSRAYKKALTNLKLTKEYVDCCYKAEYVNHYYSDNDIKKYKKKWLKNIEN